MEWAYAIAPKAHIVLLADASGRDAGRAGPAEPDEGHRLGASAATRRAPSSRCRSAPTSRRSAAARRKTQFARFDQTFIAGQAKGDTFFASSGDDGSVGVIRSHRASTVGSLPEVCYPNVSPYVTSVGGTQVQYNWTWNPTTRTSRSSPTAAEIPPTSPGRRRQRANRCGTRAGLSIATGGGLSSVYPRRRIPERCRGRRRQPSWRARSRWNAAVNGGVLVYHTYFPSIEGPPAWGVFGGTSASSPQVAALTAIANAARKVANKGPIGDLNTVIYGSGFNHATCLPRHRPPDLRHRNPERRPGQQPNLGSRRRRKPGARPGHGLPDDRRLRPDDRLGLTQGNRVHRGARRLLSASPQADWHVKEGPPLGGSSCATTPSTGR